MPKISTISDLFLNTTELRSRYNNLYAEGYVTKYGGVIAIDDQIKLALKNSNNKDISNIIMDTICILIKVIMETMTKRRFVKQEIACIHMSETVLFACLRPSEESGNAIMKTEIASWYEFSEFVRSTLSAESSDVKTYEDTMVTRYELILDRFVQH